MAASADADVSKANFLKDVEEKEDMNQYWYSQHTIDVFVQAIEECGGNVAFLSTPSLYYSVSADLRRSCKCFDFDATAFGKDPGFVFYDFNKPEDISPDLHGTFDLVVIDPPFITHEVWAKYAEASELLLKSGTTDEGKPIGKVLGTTIRENEAKLRELLGVSTCKFRPSIPNLVYYYETYANFECPALAVRNDEIPPMDSDEEEEIRKEKEEGAGSKAAGDAATYNRRGGSQ